MKVNCEKDFTFSKRRMRALRTAVACGLFLPLCAVSASLVYAGELPTEPTGELHYKAPDYDVSQVFTKYEEGAVKSTLALVAKDVNIIKLVASDSTSNVNILCNTEVYDSGGYPTEPFDSLGEYVLAEDVANTGYNAIIVKVYDPVTRTDRYYLSQTKDISLFRSSELLEIINEKTLGDFSFQTRLQTALQSGDETAVKNLIKEVLPHIYYGQVDSAILQALIERQQTDGFLPNDLEWNAILKEEIASQYKFGSGIVTTKPSSSLDGKTYSYEKISMQSGDIWRPEDRAKYIKGGGALPEGMPEGETVLGQDYWVVGKTGDAEHLGALPPDDPLKQNIDGDDLNNKEVKIENTSEEKLEPLSSNFATAIAVKELTTGENSVIDLSYINTRGDDPIVNRIFSTDGQYSEVYTDENGKQQKTNLAAYRALYADQAKLAEGTVFRLGSYGTMGSPDPDGLDVIRNGAQDKVLITTARAADVNRDTTHLYVQLGWVPGVGASVSGGGAIGFGTGGDPLLLGILNGADQFTVEGQTSLADGIFSKYEITPVLGKEENFFTDPENAENKKGTMWYLDSYSYVETSALSDSGQAAADGTLVAANQWKTNALSMFRGTGRLHREGSLGARMAGTEPGSGRGPSPLPREQDPAHRYEPDRENIWAEAWHGKYAEAGVGQTYNGLQVGYDKLLDKRYYDGKLYTGFYVMKQDGDSHLSRGGSGEQDSLGLGIYTTWVGDKGHYLDLGLLASRMSDESKFTANTGSAIGTVTGDSHTWGYGLAAQYGYYRPLENGWFLEPSAGAFLGRVEASEYTMSNGLGVCVGARDSAIGRFALKVGRELGAQGDVYAGAALSHEFAGGAMVSQSYGRQTRAFGVASGDDTWWEWNLGGNLKISPNGVLNLQYTKTPGSDWNINGNLKWSWGGVWGREQREKAAAAQAASAQSAQSDAVAAIAAAALPDANAPAVTTAGTKEAARGDRVATAPAVRPEEAP